MVCLQMFFPLFFVHPILLYAVSAQTPVEIPLRMKKGSVKSGALGNGSLMINPGFEYEYPFLSLSVGLPAVNFDVSVETGAEELFLFDAKFDAARPFQPLYNRLHSRTSKRISPNFQTYTGWSLVNGHLVQDLIELQIDGKSIGFRQNFGSITKLFDFNYNEEYPADGALGLSWRRGDSRRNSSATAYPIFNFLKGLKKIYQIQLKEKPSIMFGAANLPRCSKTIHQIPMAVCGYRPAIIVNRFQTSTGRFDEHADAILDTGYAIIRMPKKAFNIVQKESGAVFVPLYHHFFVRCNQHISDWVFEISGEIYRLNREDVLIENPYDDEQTKGLCILTVRERSTMDGFILGLPFMRKFCISFDLENEIVGLSLPKS